MQVRRMAAVATLALITGCSAMHDSKSSGEGEEKDEVKMSINDVPAPVRDALTREAGGASITSVDKETRHGKTVYETDVMKDGKNWELVADENGKMVSKKLDNEAGEKSEASGKKQEKEEDEKDEKK
jgi:hypothetical protein